MNSPPLWLQISQAAASFITAITAVVAVAIAFFGLNRWRDETLGKRKTELAEQVLVSFYEARDVFRWVRSRGIFSGEGKSRQSSDPESEEVKRKRDSYFIPIERLHREKELFAKLQAQRYSFIAYFGENSSKPFETISAVHNEIITTASVLIQMTTDNEPPNVYQQDASLRNILGWGPAKRPDDIDNKIDSAISQIETLCKPILQRRGP